VRLFSLILVGLFLVNFPSRGAEPEPCAAGVAEAEAQPQWSPWSPGSEFVDDVAFVTHTDLLMEYEAEGHPAHLNPYEFPALVRMGVYLGRVSRVLDAGHAKQIGRYALQSEGSDQWVYFVPKEEGAPVKVGRRVPSPANAELAVDSMGYPNLRVDRVEMLPGFTIVRRHDLEKPKSQQWALVLPATP